MNRDFRYIIQNENFSIRVFKSKTLSMPGFSTKWKFLTQAYVKIEDYFSEKVLFKDLEKIRY